MLISDVSYTSRSARNAVYRDKDEGNEVLRKKWYYEMDNDVQSRMEMLTFFANSKA